MHLTIPIRLVSEANARGHWSAGAKRAKAQRGLAKLVCRSQFGAPPSPPLVITLTRVAPRRFDTDNLARAMKSVRDGVADWLCVDDGDRRLTWLYDQRRGGPKAHAVEITVEARGAT